jgi:uncharacterized protein YozE (UPF0346 family)
MPRKQKAVSSSAQLQMLANETAECFEHASVNETELGSSPQPEAESRSLLSFRAQEVEVDRPPFGLWLLKQQQHRREWIAGLAKVAKSDHRFPKVGDVDQVREYLAKQGADGDAFEALDDAERDWLST